VKIGYMYKMHIYPPKGGNHVHAMELVQGFVEAGNQVLVVDDPTMPGAENYDSLSSGSLQALCDVIDVLYIRIDARYLSEWPAVAECMAIAAGHKPIVWEINSPANETLAFSWLGGKQAGEEESWVKGIKRWVHATRKFAGIKREEKLRKELCRNVDAAICVSSALGRYAREALGINTIEVLPNGGPLISEEEIARRESLRENPAFTVFYSGSAIYPWQGLDFIANAALRAQSRAPDIRFVLAVNHRTELLPEGPNVEIREGLNREGILDSICCADACVALHPDYPWSPYGFHNSPMKLFEYMACRTPVVTSNRAQMAELIKHGESGLLCDDTADGILDQLIRLKDDPGLAANLGRAGWELIQREMSWKHNTEKTLELFQQLIDENRLTTSEALKEVGN
jgi:glycosyltransferase involved in cell wall biosynthesis